MKLANQIKLDFKDNLAIKAKSSATSVRGNSETYGAKNVNDGNKETYWATDDNIIRASITFTFDVPTSINRMLLQEYIKLGQRIKAFNIEVEIDGKWKKIDSQTTIGYKRILRFETVIASKVRINITDAKASPTISNIELYKAPKVLTEPILNRNKAGILSMVVPEKGIEIYYTLDRSEPSTSSNKYITSFLLEHPTTIKAIAYDPTSKKQTEVISKNFDISKKEWKIINITSGNKRNSMNIIDDDIKTYWSTSKESKEQQEVIIDLGKYYNLKGFTYLPKQDGGITGVITHYEFLVSKDNKNWEIVSAGEFGNIWNNPIEQKIYFNSINGKYIKINAVKIHGGENIASFAEIGVITLE